MQTNPQSRWGLRLATMCVWALAAASAAYWGLLLRAPTGGPLAPMVPFASAAPVDAGRLARLLGAVDTAMIPTPVASASSRFSLIGVVADSSGSGAALIAMDGKPAKPYRVGAAVDTGYVLQSVGPRVAVLATSRNAPPAMTLEMTAVKASTTTPGVPPARFMPPAQSAAPLVTAPNAPGMSPQRSSANAEVGGRRGRNALLGRSAVTTEPADETATPQSPPTQ